MRLQPESDTCTVREAGFDSPEAVGDLNDIAALPFTEKDEIRATQAAELAAASDTPGVSPPLQRPRSALQETFGTFLR